jgi:hypothetical protein
MLLVLLLNQAVIFYLTNPLDSRRDACATDHKALCKQVGVISLNLLLLLSFVFTGPYHLLNSRPVGLFLES